ncbi:hypothetical protein [Nocardia wallacei]|uniref:hypothetical protein n=1 Tax=Nocardia wallacei TaxID=480035 RepID=UPI00245525A5|nr:hypothetical protein [Nocardia wallacei]
MLVYAVPADLVSGGWLSSQPTDAATLLMYASVLVRSATALDLYDTDTDDLPTDAAKLAAMRDATCAQAAMWSKAEIDPIAGTVGRELSIQSQSADGGSVVYGELVTSAEVEAALSRLSSTALRILKAAGLASTRPQTW